MHPYRTPQSRTWRRADKLAAAPAWPGAPWLPRAQRKAATLFDSSFYVLLWALLVLGAVLGHMWVSAQVGL